MNYWIHSPITKKRKRRTKIALNEMNYIVKWVRDKLIILKKCQQKLFKSNLYKLK